MRLSVIEPTIGEVSSTSVGWQEDSASALVAPLLDMGHMQ
jgi:hypothetical protein